MVPDPALQTRENLPITGIFVVNLASSETCHADWSPRRVADIRR